MTPTAAQALCERILDALPQTQCTRCGYPDCAAYAQAIADGETINRCAPGGQGGVARLAAITGHPALPLHPDHGAEGPRHVAHIDENWCIGCTLCLDACPTDAIVGSHKRMHTVVEPYCTGCELCIPVCPVDCIHLENVSGKRTGWSAWSANEASLARTRYSAHLARLAQQEQTHLTRQQHKIEEKRAALETFTHTQITRDPQAPERSADAQDTQAEIERKRAVIEAALAKARSRQAAIQSR